MTKPVEKTLKPELRSLVDAKVVPFRIVDLDLLEGKDADGEEIIFVNIWHPLRNRPIDTREMIELQFAVSRLLLERGEERFPYVRHHFADGQTFGSAA